ncbi:MAG: hypothetical protein WAL51_15100 [Candidatus Acidiferrales bacterium]
MLGITRRSIVVGAGVLAAAFLAIQPAAFAQDASTGQSSPDLPKASQTTTPPQTEPPKPDPVEEAAYKAFFDSSSGKPEDEIQLGEAFVAKYPNSKYDESVYARLTQAYLTENKLDKMYAAGDKALTLNPDDATVLVIVGWTIPHNYDPNDMDADRKLDKAEGYEKHAIVLLGTMAKPAAMTDDVFTKAKNSALSQAHAGLGLVYFRRGDYDNSVKELTLSEQLASQPDPTDFFVMGVDLQQQKKFSEAADAFTKCANIPGGFVARCKQMADQAKKSAASQPK